MQIASLKNLRKISGGVLAITAEKIDR